jgi:hypothetical protein
MIAQQEPTNATGNHAKKLHEGAPDKGEAETGPDRPAHDEPDHHDEPRRSK